MKGQTVKKFLKASYSKGKPSIDGYQLNKNLSGKRAQVYYNPNTKQSVVTHRGSQGWRDWVKTNTAMALGYEKGNRFKHAKKIQKQAEKMYGASNITTIGHSLGGRIAEKVGQKSNKIITYNKAATPKSILQHTSSKQVDIRTSNDAVSALSKLQRKKGDYIEIKKNVDPITAHGYQHLNSIKNKSI